MSRSLPEMGDWDGVFDETYLQTYVPSVDPERTRAEARGAADLAGIEPGAEILDCPTGFGRHAIALAEESYRVTGLDRSPALLSEAESRRGDAEWPPTGARRLPRASVRGRELRRRLQPVLSLGYLERDQDVGVPESSGACFDPVVRS